LDVMVDQDLRAHLIECNIEPSLAVEADLTTVSAREEDAVKRGLCRSLVQLLTVRSRGLSTDVPSMRDRESVILQRLTDETAALQGFERVHPTVASRDAVSL